MTASFYLTSATKSKVHTLSTSSPHLSTAPSQLPDGALLQMLVPCKSLRKNSQCLMPTSVTRKFAYVDSHRTVSEQRYRTVLHVRNTFYFYLECSLQGIHAVVLDIEIRQRFDKVQSLKHCTVIWKKSWIQKRQNISWTKIMCKQRWVTPLNGWNVTIRVFDILVLLYFYAA